MVLQHLVKEKHLSEEEKEIALIEQKISGHSMDTILTDAQFVSEDVLVQTLCKLRKSPFISLENRTIPESVLHYLPQELKESCLALPIDFDSTTNTLTVAMNDVDDIKAYDKIKNFLSQGEALRVVTAKKSELLENIHEKLSPPHVEKLFSIQKTVGTQQINELLYKIITDAVYHRASDIHFSPEKYFIQVRYRCDGILRNIIKFHYSWWSSLCIQLKVLSNIDITETRKSQDGRFSLPVFGRFIDIRSSSHRTIHGENIVLRILDKKHSLFSKTSVKNFSQFTSNLMPLLKKPDGIIILTGPTGSGKTTTLYNMVQLLDHERLNIMTLEEPVEYEFSNIRQSEVRENSPMTFAKGMQSILRQDPDVILLGEIRDKETAHIALRASMTGHKVLTTLHTTSALGAIYRFFDFHISSTFLVGNIRGIVSQRLVRILCPLCKEPSILSSTDAKKLKVSPDFIVYQSKGCKECNFQGYKGRQMIAEIITITPELEELILENKPIYVLEEQIRSQGVPSLLMDGIKMMRMGETSLEEIERVVGV